MKQCTRDNGMALQAILAADVSELFMRGNSIHGFLCSNGGKAWWNEREFWFSKEFRVDVDTILSSDVPEAVYAGQSPRNGGVT